MDHICTSTSKFNNLDNIAKLSAHHTVEIDEYIKLAIVVQQYISDPSDELFEKLKQQLQLCTVKFPKFNQTRQILVSILMSTGYLTRTNNSEDINISESTTSQEVKTSSLSTVEETVSNTKNNVINIFTKKPIDKIE